MSSVSDGDRESVTRNKDKKIRDVPDAPVLPPASESDLFGSQHQKNESGTLTLVSQLPAISF